MVHDQNGIFFCFNEVVVSCDFCYHRGLICMEGECWEYAIEEFAQAISNLIEKFHTSFPECDGNIIHKEGEIIHVDMGLRKKILPCIRYNIFEDETELITKAFIRKVRGRTSEAEIS